MQLNWQLENLKITDDVEGLQFLHFAFSVTDNEVKLKTRVTHWFTDEVIATQR